MTEREVYIALLRGINVGGNKIVMMADLKKVFEKLGFGNVKTYIQSGNVVFSGDKKREGEIEESVKAAIEKRFKFKAEVMVLSLDELEEMVEKTPFHEDKLAKGGRIHFTLLFEKPAKENIVALAELRRSITRSSPDGDELEIIGRTIYVLCQKGWSKSPLNSSVTEKILGVGTTSRNVDTMKKLLEMGKEI